MGHLAEAAAAMFREYDERIAFLTSVVQELEWSGYRIGPGAHMDETNGTAYSACPECGGLPPDDPDWRGDFMKSAGGHRSGCKIAAALGRPTVIPEGETGSLAI